MRNEKFDLTGIKVCDYDLDSSFLEATHNEESYSKTNVTETHEMERNVEPVAVQDVEEQPAETLVSESRQSEFDVGPHDIDIDKNTDAIFHFNSGGGNVQVSDLETCSIVPGLESSPITDSVFDNNHCMPDGFAAPPAVMDKINDVDGSIHTDILGIPTAQFSQSLPILEDEFEENRSKRTGVDAMETPEDRVEIRKQVEADGPEAANDSGSKRTDEYTMDQTPLNRDPRLKESENNILEGINEAQILASASGYDDKDSKCGCSYSENTRVDCTHGISVVLDAKEDSLTREENSVSLEADLHITMLPETITIESPLVDQNDVSSPFTLKSLMIFITSLVFDKCNS